MDAMSSYYSAQSDYEVTVTEKKYEKLINAAGNNQAKAKKLEEKKEKEIAAIKTKYARKQSKMQVAQAIAQTAISAISAYSSAMAGVPYPANLVLAPIAAGLALAAGAIQIATIKKQQQAQEAGYYEGGFTGGRSYRRRAGVVHEGEFVANHARREQPAAASSPSTHRYGTAEQYRRLAHGIGPIPLNGGWRNDCGIGTCRQCDPQQCGAGHRPARGSRYHRTAWRPPRWGHSRQRLDGGVQEERETLEFDSF